MGGIIAVGLVTIGIILGLILIAVVASFFKLWLQAYLSGAHVSMFSLIAMRLRRVPPNVVVGARISAVIEETEPEALPAADPDEESGETDL